MNKKQKHKYIVSFPRNTKHYNVYIDAYTDKQALSKAVHSKQLPTIILYQGKYYRRGSHLLIHTLELESDYTVELSYSEKNTISVPKNSNVSINPQPLPSNVQEWLSLF